MPLLSGAEEQSIMDQNQHQRCSRAPGFSSLFHALLF